MFQITDLPYHISLYSESPDVFERLYYLIRISVSRQPKVNDATFLIVNSSIHVHKR